MAICSFLEYVPTKKDRYDRKIKVTANLIKVIILILKLFPYIAKEQLRRIYKIDNGPALEPLIEASNRYIPIMQKKYKLTFFPTE
uniref:hypothetical protein n=1 Tax=Polynucleobacter sp. TaxID=2029855 RepID=UPI0040473C3D